MKIKELADGAKIESFYIIRRSELKKASNGNLYLEAQLSDGVDFVKGRRFDFNSSPLNPNTVVKVAGRYDAKYNSIQIYSLDVAEKGDYPRDLFLPKCPESIELMWEKLLDLIDVNVKNSELNEMLKVVLEKHGEEFREAPGALAHHHAYLGGLLEHTLSVTEAAKALAQLYRCDVCLTVTGAILHDVGKIWEYDWKGLQFEMSDEGALLGHIPLGLSVLSVYAKNAIKDENLKNKLLHIIGSHHGVVEWGAVKEPMIPEAIVVSTADNVDANIFKIFAAKESAQPGETTKWERTMQRHVWVKE